jgi:hypothetical protein
MEVVGLISKNFYRQVIDFNYVEVPLVLVVDVCVDEKWVGNH